MIGWKSLVDAVTAMVLLSYCVTCALKVSSKTK